MSRFKVLAALGTQTLELGALEACPVLESFVHGHWDFFEREVRLDGTVDVGPVW